MTAPVNWRERIEAAGGGVFRDMDAETYHADPCPAPSLSASIAFTIRDECAAKARHKHPRLNQNFEPEEKAHFDIGKAGHFMMLEPHKFADAVAIIKADDYKTNAAKQARDEARQAGKVPLLTKQADMVNAMRSALMEDVVARDAFVSGDAEVSAFWYEEDFDIWCRQRPDWVPHGGKFLIDYKAMASVHPESLSKAIGEHGYYQRADFYLDGWGKATGTAPEEYWFVAQEKEEPHLVTVFKLSWDDLQEGRAENYLAKATYSECLHTGIWPNYAGNKPMTLGMKPYARQRLQARRDNQEYGVRGNAAQRGAATLNKQIGA